MRLPSKQVLLRMYPTWDISKQKRMSARISLKHGQAFLRLLRSGSSKKRTSLQQRSPSAILKGKHKLSPGGDDRSKKRFKVDTDQVPHGEVSSNIPVKDGEKDIEEQQVRLTRSAAKLQGNGRVSSQSALSLQSGTKSGPSIIAAVKEQMHVHPEGPVDDKGTLEDDSTVSSSFGPQNELFQENLKTSGEQASLSGSESTATNDRESEVSVNVQEHGLPWRHKRKSLCPRKILRKMEQEEASAGVPGNFIQEEWLTQAEDSASSTPTDERNVPESSQEQVRFSDPDKEILSECIETPPARLESPSVMESEEQSGQLNLLLDQDPMLAEGNFSCSSDQTMVPSSSQGAIEEAVSFPGLRFQSIQDFPSKKNDTGDSVEGNSASLLGEGFADVVNSSLIEETVQGDSLDNLLPGLNMLHVGRGVVEGNPLNEKGCRSQEKKDKTPKVKKHKHKSPHKNKRTSSARRLDMQHVGDKEASHDDKESSPPGTKDKLHKKRKVKKNKHKSHEKCTTKSTSPGKFPSSDQSSPLPKSPVFGRILPVSNWASLEDPVTSPCRVQLVDYLTSSQEKLPPKEGDEGNTRVQEVSSEAPQEVHQADQVATTLKEQVSTEDECPGVQLHEQDVHTEEVEKEPSESLSSPISSFKIREEPAEETSAGNRPCSSAVKGQRSPSHQGNDQSRAVRECGTTEGSSPHFPTGQEDSGQVCGSLDADGKIDTPSVGNDGNKRTSDKTKKAVRSRNPRGAGGWEQSLRQRPQKVSPFQVGRDPNTPKKGAKKVSPKKDTSRRLQQDIHSQMLPLPREKSNDVSSISNRPSTPWRKKEPRAVATPPPLDVKGTEGEGTSGSMEVKIKEEAEKYGCIFRGQLVFGKMKGFCWWPGRIVHHYDRSIREPPPPLTRWVQWFGDDKYSLLSLGQIAGLEDFPDYFSVSAFQKWGLYQKACYEALNVAAKRAGKDVSVAMPTPPAYPGASIKERQEYKAKMLERCREMQDWANDKFLPQGRESIQPSEEDKQTPPIPESPPPSPVQDRKRSPIKHSSRNSPEKEPFEDKREERMKDVRGGKWTIEALRIEYLEVAYLYDCEGYQAHCCICAEGNQITLCDNQGCYHSYCTVCMDNLVGPQESKRVSEQEPWSCYLCSADCSHGYLTRRDDWQEQLVDFFNRDQVADFEPLRMYKPLLLSNRRPIRVLSLFDGLGTGMLVLRELGFDVECYYASEVSEEAITVAAVRLKGQIQQIGDVQKITPKELKSWGPFDILIGGSPCNDLSIVNPARKGLAGGTGLLFFEFYRILRDLQPLPDDPRPFFWLFENVVFMGRKDKLNICRFLQCNPVMIDSRHMSPTHRARYYWGNLPGMHRPYVAGADNPLCLQECLEPHCDRQAQFSKVGTITTTSHSIRQTKDAILPVIMNGREDGLWSTELERLFGFPDHYTDVGNLSRTARQKLLGKAWSVPVIRHLMAPLKDYFACSAQNE
eukprot:XP_787412.3 PREDICTED: DNA (cytosine-5)-methyltransferase 3A [Strongylocentrotus purpuratus]